MSSVVSDFVKVYLFLRNLKKVVGVRTRTLDGQARVTMRKIYLFVLPHLDVSEVNQKMGLEAKFGPLKDKHKN